MIFCNHHAKILQNSRKINKFIKLLQIQGGVSDILTHLIALFVKTLKSSSKTTFQQNSGSQRKIGSHKTPEGVKQSAFAQH